MPHRESPESQVPGETEQLAAIDNGRVKQDKLVLDERQESDVDREGESLPDGKLKPRSQKRKWLWFWGIIALIGVSGGLGWRWWQSTQTQNTASSSPGVRGGQPQVVPVKLATVEEANVRDALELNGTLEAPRATTLKPEIDGRISQILVGEGDRVRQGQLVARIDTQELQAQLQQSQAGLQEALSQLSELQAGSRPEEIAQGKARLAQAQANLKLALNGSRPEEIAQAQARLNQAQANLEQSRSNRPQQIRLVQAQIDSAQAQVTLTQVRVQRYRSLQQEGAISRDRLDEVEANDKTARASLEEAQRNLQQVQNTTQQDIAQKQAAVTEAQQALQQLRNGTRPEEIAQRQAALNEAQQALRQLQNGSRPEEIDRARSQVSQANAQVKAAFIQLQKTNIVAPFTGTIGDIPVKTGDFVSSGDDLTTITTNNLLELNLSVPLGSSSQLRLGLPVEILDAQGKAIATGKVSFIAPNVNANSQTVLAKASFANSTRNLLNQQFVQARIIWNQTSGVVIPVNAVTRIGGETFVFVAEKPAQSQTGKSQLVARQRSVKLGEIQGNNYQVLSGLETGTTIVTSGLLNLTDGAAIAPE
jgi:RND family efflux transporter MFP subunit